MQAGYGAPKTANGSADAVRRSGRQHGRSRKRENPDGSPGSQTPRMRGNSMHGNQEIPVLPATLRKRRAGRRTREGTSFMNGTGKSDHRVVPEKVPNKGCRACGGAGGKAVDQGERNGRTHEPDTGPGNRVKGASGRAGSRTERQKVKVHNAAAPCERETASGRLLSAEETSCAGSGSSHMGRV